MYHYISRCCGGEIHSDIPREDFIVGECPACCAGIDDDWNVEKLFPTVYEYFDKRFRFEFDLTIAGYGKNSEEAWRDATEGFSLDPGGPEDFRMEEEENE